MSNPENFSNIVGGNPKKGRAKSDFYPTPPEVTQALLDFLKLDKDTYIWEPAAGERDMVKVIQQNGFMCHGTDISQNIDFLSVGYKHAPSFDWIITNPPFSLADKFIEHASGFGKPFAFLLKSQYWHAKSRVQLFEKHYPDYICPLTWRPDFSFKDPESSHNPLMDVMWCIWDNRSILKYPHPLYVPLRKPEVKK